MKNQANMRQLQHLDRVPQPRRALIAAVGLITFCLTVSSSGTAQDLPSPPFNAEVGRGDWPQLGGTSHRNNTPEGKNIPTDWDISWTAPRFLWAWIVSRLLTGVYWTRRDVENKTTLRVLNVSQRNHGRSPHVVE